MEAITWEAPIRTVSEANTNEHWSQKARRKKGQQLFTRLHFEQNVKSIEFPIKVKLTRLSPRTLDDDNLVSAFKAIRDELSELILPEFQDHYINKRGKAIPIKGRADSDERIKWEYGQEKGPHGVRFEIVSI